MINRKQLLGSLTPLYLGRTASFVLETNEIDGIEVERIREALCREYEELKPYLLVRWNEPRGNTRSVSAINKD